MNVLRQNTDYAMRLVGHMAAHYSDGAIPVRVMAEEEDVSYQFACKIMQKLHDAGLARSEMGSKGGYSLVRGPGEITLLDVVRAMQGGVTVNRCTCGEEKDMCPRKEICPVNDKLCELQGMVDSYLASVTIQDLLNGKAKK
ncbi:MAG: Rrf2 family transcriptional regulator [Sedimentisphaerales bacterium]|nr:Rrf2 family transcriptional regulator [Sedimentisphaerales bacterium]